MFDFNASRSIAKLTFILAALALVASACGGSDSGSADGGTTEVEAAAEPAESSSETDSDTDEPVSDDSDVNDSSDDSTDEPDEEPTEEPESRDEQIEAATAGDEYASPLSEFLGFPTGGNEQEQQVALSRRIEQSVQTCMREQGFEYTAADISSVGGFFGSDLGADLSEEEYIDVYGYGISTGFDEEFEAQADIEDPNAELTSAMSDGERAAWELALTGEQPEIDEATGLPIDPETGEPTSDFSVFLGGGGCYNEAQTEVFGNFEVLFSLGDKFEEIEDRFYADPRIIEVSGDWATCMAEASYPFDRPGDAEEEVGERFQAWVFPVFSSFEQDFGEDGEADGDDEGAGIPELTTEQSAALAEIQDYERAVARADFDCDSGFREISPAVQAEYELQFIDENRDVLESARAGG